MNDYLDFLQHHGIKGQKWGVQNGPPYPLSDAVKKRNTKILNKAVKQANKEPYYSNRIDYLTGTGLANFGNDERVVGAYAKVKESNREFQLYIKNSKDEYAEYIRKLNQEEPGYDHIGWHVDDEGASFPGAKNATYAKRLINEYNKACVEYNTLVDDYFRNTYVKSADFRERDSEFKLKNAIEFVANQAYLQGGDMYKDEFLRNLGVN